jgi:hypothetical protein
MISLFLFINGISSQIIQDTVVKVHSNVTIQVKLPAWKPKTASYDPSIVDWKSVISGCRATCRYDKRLCNFYVRASAHDSLSVSEGFGGADGSLVLTTDEIKRPENNYDSFTFLLSKNALALAKRYNTSVADIIAVCGAVGTEYQGGPTIISNDPVQPFLVGRFDKIVPNPANALAPANLNTTGFANFAESRNLTTEEMTALMGSHSLLDTKGCERTNGSQCDPTIEPCTDLRMYRWSNMYYRDVCSPKIRINDPPVRSTLPLKSLEFLKKQELCKFTSPELRQRGLDIFDTEVVTLFGTKTPDAAVIDLDVEEEHVSWFSSGNIARQWMYTINDAWLGLACQNKLPQTDYNTNIGNAMRSFRINSVEWDRVYIRAYKKMINTGATWAIPGGFAITGDECRSGYVPALTGITLDCSLCNETARRNGIYSCNANCKCKTGLSNSVKFYTGIV